MRFEYSLWYGCLAVSLGEWPKLLFDWLPRTHMSVLVVPLDVVLVVPTSLPTSLGVSDASCM